MEILGVFKMDEPKYGRSAALVATGLRPESLQRHINRGVIGMTAQNPGRGKRRLFSAINVVQGAILARTEALRIDLAIGKEIADNAAQRLRKMGTMEWDLYIVLRPDQLDMRPEGIKVNSTGDALARFGSVIGDPRDMRVSELVEPFEGTAIPEPWSGTLVNLTRRSKKHLGDADYTDDRPIDPERREKLAQMGVHAEPAIIFPLGEIVNGALARLRAIDERGAA